MLIPSIVSIVLVTLFVIYARIRKKRGFSDKESWKLVDSDYEEWPRRPSTLPKEKNKEDIYLDRLPIVADTTVTQDEDVVSFTSIAGEPINSLPLYTTAHSNEEHFLTTIHVSFHRKKDIFYMDILSLDKDFPLKNNNQFSLLFSNGQQWDFVFSKDGLDEYAASIPLTKQQLQYIVENKLDKWRIRRDKDDYYTVGAFNFEIKKYVYKPEIQATIQTMAQRMLQYV